MPTHTTLTTFDNFVFNWKTSPQSELEILGMGDLVVRNFWDGSWEYWLNAQWEFDSAIYQHIHSELQTRWLDAPRP